MLEYMSENIAWSCVIGVLALLLLVGIYDVLQTKHAIRRNFPIVGHLRYWLETIGPEIRQYFVAHDKEERPFNRDDDVGFMHPPKDKTIHLDSGRQSNYTKLVIQLSNTRHFRFQIQRRPILLTNSCR